MDNLQDDASKAKIRNAYVKSLQGRAACRPLVEKITDFIAAWSTKKFESFFKTEKNRMLSELPPNTIIVFSELLKGIPLHSPPLLSP